MYGLCCQTPSLTWVTTEPPDEDYQLVCGSCGVPWSPESGSCPEPDLHNPEYLEQMLNTKVEIALGAEANYGEGERGERVDYQLAWMALLESIESKTSWGKNALKDLMLKCLTQPDQQQ